MDATKDSEETFTVSKASHAYNIMEKEAFVNPRITLIIAFLQYLCIYQCQYG